MSDTQIPREGVARERLWQRIRIEIAYALRTYAGREPGRGLRDVDGWRQAQTADDLVDSIMTHLRAGLEPVLDTENVESSVRWARSCESDNAAARSVLTTVVDVIGASVGNEALREEIAYLRQECAARNVSAVVTAGTEASEEYCERAAKRLSEPGLFSGGAA